MSDDARFEDGAEEPLNLKAQDAEDLKVVSALSQDSVFPASAMKWQRGARRFAVLLNRFRWEDRARAEAQGRRFERVQSMLVIEDVLHVATQGVGSAEPETILSLLSIGFEPGEEGGGRLVLTLAGDGALGLDVECIDVTLKDVTRPYLAPSGHAPDHPRS